MTPIPTVPDGYGAILADPPWAFNLWWGSRSNKTPAGVPSQATTPHYEVMREPELAALPIEAVAAKDCVLFLWTCWPVLEWSMRVAKAWGFEYKTCGFCWVKGDALPLFPEDQRAYMGLGYWSRSNTETCLIYTRGHPKRLNADVRQVILEPRREHSRKPSCVYERIERLVAGPYLELFARSTPRPGWTAWGNEVGKYGEVA